MKPLLHMPLPEIQCILKELNLVAFFFAWQTKGSTKKITSMFYVENNMKKRRVQIRP